MNSGAVQLLTSWIESSCETLSILLNQKIEFEQPVTETHSLEALQKSHFEGLVYPVVLVSPMEGQFHVLLENSDAGKLVSLLLGGNPEVLAHSLGEMQLNVMMEALEQLTGGLKSLLAELTGRDVKLTLAKPQSNLPTEGSQRLSIRYVLHAEEQRNLSITILLPIELAERFASLNSASVTPPASRSSTKLSKEIEVEEEDVENLEMAAILEKENSQVDFLMDVQLRLQVVLGRTSVAVQDLIGLGEGSVVELDQVAGEPVELYVHGRLIGYGEVTVVGDRFGVKVLELASREDMADC